MVVQLTNWREKLYKVFNDQVTYPPDLRPPFGPGTPTLLGWRSDVIWNRFTIREGRRKMWSTLPIYTVKRVGVRWPKPPFRPHLLRVKRPHLLLVEEAPLDELDEGEAEGEPVPLLVLLAPRRKPRQFSLHVSCM